MLIILLLLKILFGLALLAALGLSISILISIITDYRIGGKTIRQIRYRDKTLKIKGNYYEENYQYE